MILTEREQAEAVLSGLGGFETKYSCEEWGEYRPDKACPGQLLAAPGRNAWCPVCGEESRWVTCLNNGTIRFKWSV